MYFVKAKKNFDATDANEPTETGYRRDRYQRSDSARLLLQALPQKADPVSQQHLVSDNGKLPNQKPAVSAEVSVFGSGVDPASFRPEELPDGACYRPRKDWKNVTSCPAAVPVSADPSQDGSSAGGSTQEAMEKVRHAEYVGTFSVSGSDKAARERQMESQLEQMRTATQVTPVDLIISGEGVKVVLRENGNVFMEHSLKRIWYATCDPEYNQFSFLAREPKTSAEVQYCHAFTTATPAQAEELITIVGDAFKSTYTESEGKSRPPTFHELIEQQVQQQQAKFREIEKEAKSALQQKLQQIATPTPFSETAQHRMERRRQSEDFDPPAGQGRVWAKEVVERRKTTSALSPDRSSNNVAGNRRSEIPSHQNMLQSSPFKRNSVPSQSVLTSIAAATTTATTTTTVLPSSPPPSHLLSAMSIREHVETKTSNSKFKGSPVTALKNEIDRRIALSNGFDLPSSSVQELDFRQEKARLKQQHQAMANRPLPLPPDTSLSPSPSRAQHSKRQSQGDVHQKLQQQQQQHLQRQLHHPQQPPLPQQRSFDDYHLPRSSSSQAQLSSSGATSRNGLGGNVRLRDSPRRHQPRPMSEIAVSSSAGSHIYEQQRQSLLSNFAASFNLSPQQERGDNGMYIYGPPNNEGQKVDDEGTISCNDTKEHERGRDINRRGRGGVKDEGKDGKGGRGGFRYQKNDDSHPAAKSSQGPPPSYHAQAHQKLQQAAVHRSQSGDRMPMPTGGRGKAEPPVLRYQNDSPLRNSERDGAGSKHPEG